MIGPDSFRCPYVSGSLTGLLKMMVYLDNRLVAIGLAQNSTGTIVPKLSGYSDALLIFFKTNFPEYEWIVGKY